MKIRLSFALPFGLFLFALFYIAFTLSLETGRMIGDTFGYDPGSRLVPLLCAGLLGLVMLVEMGRARRMARPRAGEDAAWLVVLNIVVAVVFIATFRYLGYLLATAATLFVLIACNLRAVGAGWRAPAFFKGLVLTLAYAVLAYSAIRFVVKTCFRLAREMQMPLLRDPTLQAGLATAILVLVLVAVHLLARRVGPIRDVWVPVQISVGVTMTVFVIFRLFFLVQLPRGVIWW
ncbi:MAG: hypothetical protein ACK5JR_04235 [Tropicimonas sp.]|uniref:hypothetical protein n=1 Tax=Tropicimonas sp. TaxID=2067044 RepID=UPI003A8B0060